MTATLTSGTEHFDFSHYAYSGYSSADRRPRPAAARRTRAAAAPSYTAPSHTTPFYTAPFYTAPFYAVRLPRHLSASARDAAGRATVAVVHLRRRVVAALAFTGTLLLLWLGAGTVLANRGDDPASVPPVRPGATHVAQPGESLWTIAEEHRGSTEIVAYVDELIELNGGVMIDVGQVILLP